ncbi:MAG: hypothetical protein R2844_14375 [Caldilineales bacterium]
MDCSAITSKSGEYIMELLNTLYNLMGLVFVLGAVNLDGQA